MDYTKAVQCGKDTVICGVKNFNAAQILDCGQCFRWIETRGGFIGIAHGRELKIKTDGDNLILFDVSLDEFESTWKDYFDLGRDYTAIVEAYSRDSSLARATAFSPGIRVLQQDPWETLITFILSQNSNIPRIKKMVAELCKHFGEPIAGCSTPSYNANNNYAFPTPEALAGLEIDALAPIKPGYRAPYIRDAARRVASRQIDLSALGYMSTEDIKTALLQIHGVGPKVAECVLLFGFGRVEVCPMDVWIKRVMTCLYPNGLPVNFKPTAGIAQQYLFHWVRNFPEVLNESD